MGVRGTGEWRLTEKRGHDDHRGAKFPRLGARGNNAVSVDQSTERKFRLGVKTRKKTEKGPEEEKN